MLENQDLKNERSFFPETATVKREDSKKYKRKKKSKLRTLHKHHCINFMKISGMLYGFSSPTHTYVKAWLLFCSFDFITSRKAIVFVSMVVAMSINVIFCDFIFS